MGLSDIVARGAMLVGAAAIKARRFNRHDGPPAVGGASASDDPSVAHKDTAYSRVRPHAPQAALPERQRVRHVARVGHASSGASGRSSLTNLSKSSASWKFL